MGTYTKIKPSTSFLWASFPGCRKLSLGSVDLKYGFFCINISMFLYLFNIFQSDCSFIPRQVFPFSAGHLTNNLKGKILYLLKIKAYMPYTNQLKKHICLQTIQ